MNFDNEIKEIRYYLNKLFPIARSLTGKGNIETLQILSGIVPELEFKKIKCGTKVFDWEVPPEWEVEEGYILNKYGKKILDYKDSNLHVLNYSKSFVGQCSLEELRKHIYTLEANPDWIPYRTSYYDEKWGFCAKHSLLESSDFVGPFFISLKTTHNKNGNLVYGESLKKGESKEEILISTYFCHPSLANDNLSGFLTAALLFRYISNIKTKFSYRLIIVPETIGAISFLSQSNHKLIKGGTVITTTAGPGKHSIKESFNRKSWLNKLSHIAIADFTNNDYITYPFIPDGSDERQYSSPGFRIETPSLHKSKYYEYDEYHTSADNLDFISEDYLYESLSLYKLWFNYIDSYCFPKRTSMQCEFQLGKRGLYPKVGGTFNQNVANGNELGFKKRTFDFEIKITGEHLDCFNWLMHLADGSSSNIDISNRSNIPLKVVNESISLFKQKGLLEL